MIHRLTEQFGIEDEPSLYYSAFSRQVALWARLYQLDASEGTTGFSSAVELTAATFTQARWEDDANMSYIIVPEGARMNTSGSNAGR